MTNATFLFGFVLFENGLENRENTHLKTKRKSAQLPKHRGKFFPTRVLAQVAAAERILS